MPTDFPLGQVTGATAASPATADSCEAANMPGFCLEWKADGWIMDQLGSSWDIMVFTTSLFFTTYCNFYHKGETQLFWIFFGEERCLDLEGVHLQNFKKTLIAHKCPKEMNLSRAFSWIAQITCYLTLEMPALSRIIEEMEHPSTSQESKWMAVS